MLSVVIPVFNNEDLLDHQLAAVLGQDVDDDLEVLIADNGSTDGSRSVARRWAARDTRVRPIDASARRGPGAARNEGARQATSDLLFFCDGDDIVHPGWLAALRAGLQEGHIVVGALDVTSLDGLPPAPPLDPWPRQFLFLPAGLGANMAVQRKAFEAVGGFDEALRVGEDLDLCWRLQLGGYHLERRMDAVVAKRGRPAGGSLFAQSVGYGRSDAVLYRRFRSAGMPRRLWQAVRVWGWLVVHVPALARSKQRRDWLRVFFIQVGRLIGSLQEGVLYL